MKETEHAVDLRDGRRDTAQAVSELAERLPDALLALARLTYNYRWSWLPGGPELFAEMDAAQWDHSRGNPRYVIESVGPRRLKELARNSAFVERAGSLAARVDEELCQPFLETGQAAITPDRPMAYFCSEFGIHSSLPLYGGGLGVLAGDLVKAASDLALPMVGVGLLYVEGYFHQRVDNSGWQHEYWTPERFARQPAVVVTGPDREPLTVDIVIRDRTVRIQTWRIDVGRVPVYLLDTDRPDNHPIDRLITSRLYVGDRHIRLAQYAVLGIGGVRMLEAMEIHPRLVHLNEGHAALSSFERLRRHLASGRPFDEALAAVRQQTIFTTHTPVAAGNEGYHPAEIEPVLGTFIDGLGLPRRTFYDLGRVEPGNEQEPANITPFALRTSRAANAVSRRHGEVARGMWRPLWPDRAESEVPIAHVTNGVHTMTWMAPLMQALLERYLGSDWRRRQCDPGLWEGVLSIPDRELWEVRCALRNDLVAFVREQSIRNRLGRGEAPEYVEAAARVFDPAALTIGFARRVATYKRLYLLIRRPEKGVRLLSDSSKAIQVVVAGKAHPQDDEAKQTLRAFFQFKQEPVAGQRVVFLDDYDLNMAPRLVAGVDLWLNLPRPPLEASGTSGMKVTLNGGLNLSVLDGWWAEGYDGKNGWAIASPDADPHAQDDHDADALFEQLGNDVIPLFYDRDGDGIPQRWLERVKNAMRSLIPRFTAERMLREYIATLYTPR